MKLTTRSCLALLVGVVVKSSSDGLYDVFSSQNSSVTGQNVRPLLQRDTFANPPVVISPVVISPVTTPAYFTNPTLRAQFVTASPPSSH